jgi:hypothetical protein
MGIGLMEEVPRALRANVPINNKWVVFSAPRALSLMPRYPICHQLCHAEFISLLNASDTCVLAHDHQLALRFGKLQHASGACN